MATKKKEKVVYCNGFHHQFPVIELLRERGDGTLPAVIYCQCGHMVELTEYAPDGRLASDRRLTVAEWRTEQGVTA